MDADRSTHDEPIIDNPAGITTDQVWEHMQKASFAVVSHVTPSGDPRSSGVLIKAETRPSQDRRDDPTDLP